ncbi:MAG: hypothetical protein AAF441_03730 [Pseudomonadota bacterium]
METSLDIWLAAFGSARSYLAFSVGGALVALALTPSMSRREAIVSLAGNVAVAVFAGPGALASMGVESEPLKLLLHSVLGLTGVSVARGLIRLGKAFEADPVGTLRTFLSKAKLSNGHDKSRDG